ncbi:MULTISPECIES: acyl-CoA dehydrogenase family protein [unclassified Streptomyces]|uniref:acyl-CoA dehydrogenase family protein n=1 Tax=unclassified Streptomyces TaxID=2593676 RepID=UPI00190E205E|nr:MULTISPECIES: acyl-CoA dehydrogenase family protein [unclassified Streptomyces]MBK3569781.1 acyl-CoA/acyl-ACP dehydrogenase [Streptomyces sp. MBT62]MBK6015409.1 acyl-CoA/acyl-ACP dehydrogenase [Streptomyces sp. MBT53]
MSSPSGAPPVATAEEARVLARDLAEEFGRTAPKTDESASFPAVHVQRLRETGLLGLLVPRRYGGPDLGLADMSAVGRLLGHGCASTAMIWAMHCQQVATLVAHGGETLREQVLPAVAAGDCLLASITTEAGKGGHLLSARAPLGADDDGLLLERDAPVVTAGMEADAYLVTMRTGADSQDNDVSLAFVPRRDAQVEFRSGWETLGMRGTASVGLRLRARLAEHQLIGGPGGFPPVAVATLVPVGHLAWSSVWLGIAQGSLARVVALLRDPGVRARRGLSDLTVHDLARARLRLDGAAAFLRTCLVEYEELRAREEDGPGRFSDPAFQLHINGLKVLVSETAFEAVNDLVSIAGLHHGYTRSPHTPLERAFRDLRSASMMYSNDRLLLANGRLALLDREVRLAGTGTAPSGGSPFLHTGGTR